MIGKRIGVAVVAGLVLAGGLAIGSTARAWGRHGGGEGMEAAMPVLAMVHRGHMTDAQERQTADILRAHKAALLDKTSRVSSARKAVLTQLTADVADASALGVAMDDASAAAKDLALEWAKVRAEVQALLTPEQVAELKQMRDKFMTKMDERRADRDQDRSERMDHWIDKLAR